jgi:hypothetical protein
MMSCLEGKEGALCNKIYFTWTFQASPKGQNTTIEIVFEVIFYQVTIATNEQIAHCLT